jgi:hypothetical protein
MNGIYTPVATVSHTKRSIAIGVGTMPQSECRPACVSAPIVDTSAQTLADFENIVGQVSEKEHLY